MANPPVFIDTNIANIQQEVKDLYEQISGKPLQPAQVEQLILNTLAYREGLVRQQIQDAAVQNLVSFSRAPVLDYLGELVGAYRLAASSASTTLEFQIVQGHTGVTVGQGTRVSSVDGKVVFATDEDINVPVGVYTVQVTATCTTEGLDGNGFSSGSINKILDPQPYITSAYNINVTAGGAEQEDDEEFRDRIKLAASQFTTAGSYGSYKFHAKSASPAIIDVAVTNPNPGEVLILPLMNDGSITPQQVLDAVDAACNAENVRPLTDLVIVQAPTRINYSLNVQLIIFADAIGSDVQQAAYQAIDELVTAKRQQLGQDIVASQIIAAAQVEGVYSVNLPGFTNIIVAPEEFAYCTSINVTIVGTTNG